MNKLPLFKIVALRKPKSSERVRRNDPNEKYDSVYCGRRVTTAEVLRSKLHQWNRHGVSSGPMPRVNFHASWSYTTGLVMFRVTWTRDSRFARNFRCKLRTHCRGRKWHSKKQNLGIESVSRVGELTFVWVIWGILIGVEFERNKGEIKRNKR